MTAHGPAMLRARVGPRLASAGLAAVRVPLPGGRSGDRRETARDRVIAAAEWLEEKVVPLPIGFYGTGVGAQAVLSAASVLGSRVSAVLARAGLGLLPNALVHDVAAPTLILPGIRRPMGAGEVDWLLSHLVGAGAADLSGADRASRPARARERVRALGASALMAAGILALTPTAAQAAVTATFDPVTGKLRVVGDFNNDDVDILCQGGLVKINGEDPSTGPADCAEVQSIVVDARGGNDEINLTGTATQFSSLGQVTLAGGAGNDVLASSFIEFDPAVARLIGGQGNDVMDSGGEGANLTGGAGNDILTGGAGIDALKGGTGRDSLLGGTGNDVMSGGGDHDALIGSAGWDSLLGGAGSDTLKGGAGRDSLKGGAGSDSLVGGRGADSLQGGLGNDLLRGGPGADTLKGGDGKDSLIGGEGNDTLLPGPQ